jgi:outer membrane protein assembly factor BamB
VVLVVLQWLALLVMPAVWPGTAAYALLGGLAGSLLVLLWWLLLSRAPWLERLGVLALIAVAAYATKPLLDKSIATGMMGVQFYVYAAPVLSLALVVWTWTSRRLTGGRRWASMAAAILLACAIFTTLRTEGVTGEGAAQFAWRWSPTHEERLAGIPAPPLAPAAPAPVPAVTAEARPPAKASEKPPVPEIPAVWPGFRGPGRDSLIRGPRILAGWSAGPPTEMWRRPVGPGWSSFAVRGDLIYTQEQRREEEVVSCYRLATGEPVWAHRDRVRFWESNAGAGPRATPTLGGARVYALGATGILNVLDAATGALIWTRNAAAEAGVKTPDWGFAGSPLVVGNSVIVAVSGTLAAYDLSTGAPRWSRPSGGSGYSSPQLLTIGGVPQVLLLNSSGVLAVDPATGAPLWNHPWKGDGIVQPALAAEGDIVLGSGSGFGHGSHSGALRLAVARGPAGWSVQEKWTSAGLKPYYNDFVVHKGHAFGFDGFILACIGLEDGKRKWKGGRYGYGQVALLPDQDALLVLSEEGEVALVAAAPDRFHELARFKAIEGKTWNHPVLAGDVLLVRNGEEMAAFRLPLEKLSPAP